MIDDVAIPDEVCERGEEAVEIFLTSIASGNTESIAVMCAMRTPPGLKGTDSGNFRGQMNDPFPNMPARLKKYYADYFNKKGISFAGKVYKSGLVRKGYGGLTPDPEALVSDTSDVRSVLRRNGWSAEGIVNERGRQYFDEPDKPDGYVADDIVDEHTANEVIENHGGRIKKKDYADLRQKVKAKLEGNK